MTYFGFLAIFLGVPMAILSLITIYDYKRGKWLPAALNSWKAWVVILGICIVAFVYTTPWDNYLVATNVWWYDEDLVAGIVFGYVPLEEYTFFILQPIMSGLWLLLLARYLPTPQQPADNTRIRLVSTAIIGVLWVISVIWLVLSFVDTSWKPFTYLALELSWALIPVLIQLAFGADILWRHRNAVFISIVTSTAYLSWADALAIGSGTWTIDPAQSLNIYLGGVLPIEEMIFFLLTNILCVFGITLVLAEESQPRALSMPFLRPLVRMFGEPTLSKNKTIQPDIA